MLVEEYINKSIYAGDWEMVSNRITVLEKELHTFGTMLYQYYGTEMEKSLELCTDIITKELEWLRVRKEVIFNAAKDNMQQNVYKGNTE